MKKIFIGLIAALTFGAANATVIQCDPALTGSSSYPNVRCDSSGRFTVMSNEDTSNTYNITSATVVKAAAGQVYKVSVIIAGSTPGTLNDTTTTGGATASNEIAVIPNTVGVYDVNWPANTGIVVVPGTGQTVSISWQ